MECYKTPYETLGLALVSADYINGLNKKTVVKPYKCDSCDNYHLTSILK
jgi:hypothetical protein